MAPKKSLVSDKLNLVNQIKNASTTSFYNKASLNSFISKVSKSGTFKKLGEYVKIFNYIKENDIKYKNKMFKDVSSDVKISETIQNNAISKLIKITYAKWEEKGALEYDTILANKVIDVFKENKTNLIKISATFPNKQSYDETIEPSELANINIGDKSKLKGKLFWLLRLTSQLHKCDEYFKVLANRVTTVTIKISAFPKIKAYKLAPYYRQIQKFKDTGLKLLCVPGSIIKFFEYKKKTAPSISTIKKYQTIINKMNKPEYNKSYSVEELNELASELNVSFTITDFINSDIIINAKQSNSYNIQLINSKLNHLENCNGETVWINEPDVNKLLNELKYYTKVGNQIYTKDKTYIINTTEFSKQMKQHKLDYNLNRNYIKADSNEAEYIENYYMSMHQFFNPKLFKLYKDEIDSVIDQPYKNIDSKPIISDLDFGLDTPTETYSCNNIIDTDTLIRKKERELFTELDIEKAYYNLTNNSTGVPSNAFMYYDCNYARDIDNHINENMCGYYTINITSNSEKMHMLFGSNESSIVFTTPQILTLRSHNIDFVIESCLIAPTINFKFDKKTLYKKEIWEKEDGTPFYSKMSGIFMKKNTNSVTLIKTDKPQDYIKLFTNTNDDVDISIDNDDIINVTTNKNKTLKHIGYYIHSFVSAQVLNLILSNDIANILGTKLDSVIIKKDCIDQIIYNKEIFRPKKAKIYNVIKNFDQISHYIEPQPIICNCKPKLFNGEIITKRIVFAYGKGGAGKSTDIKVNYQDYDKVIYTSLAWARGVDFSSDYPCTISSINRMIGDKCEPIKINPYCEIIAADEATLINNCYLHKMINEIYPEKRFLIIGDIDNEGFNYQCTLSNNLIEGFKMFNPSDYNCQLLQYTKNYRFDYELNEKLDQLRTYMKLNTTSQNKNKLIEEYVKSNFADCYIDKSQINYNVGDLGVSAYQESNRDFIYTNYFLSQGAQPKYITNETKYNKNIIKGTTSYIQPSHKYWDVRLFQSIHSAQGCTVSHGNNLLIVIEKNFDYCLFYTALSRARTMGQIKIVTGFNSEIF